jgi:hypothetical protein
VSAAEEYVLLVDGEKVGTLPRTPSGAIVAINQAHWYSTHGSEAAEVLRPDGQLLARWVRGERADLSTVVRARRAVDQIARHM